MDTTNPEEQQRLSELDSKRSVPKATADIIARQAVQQLTTSRQFKRQRMSQIMENENLYLGIVEKQIRNPFNECFPFMAGFVDQMRSKIDDDSELTFTHQAEADYKRAQKVNSFYDLESKSIAPHAQWSKKHRYAKHNAIFSGVAIYSYYSESTPSYKSCLNVISHYDFHCEPGGGGILENHLFAGEDSIFKTKEDILDNPYYDQEQVKAIVSNYSSNQVKDNADYDNIRNNRARALGEDPQANNYVGQDIIKFFQMYTTYKGKRYYVLVNERTFSWIRCCPIEDMFPSGLYPYVTWHTNEDPDVFWSKAPADDARPMARMINHFVNQELYNRQKRNYGQRAYDAEMFPNVAALADWRPDGLVPVDTKNGSRRIGEGMYEFKVGELTGTLDLVSWMDSYSGRKTGNSDSAEGATPKDKKVGVFQGEIAQSERLIGVKNKSYRDALSHIGLLFKYGLDANLRTKEAIKLMGAKGIEWTEITPEDLKTERDLIIQPVGGTSEQEIQRLEDQQKMTILLKGVSSVNPQWKDKQLLLLAGYTEEDAKEAFSTDTFATKELLSEAADAERQIVEGKNPPLNRGANAAFMQHILDFATDTNDLPLELYSRLIKYAMDHQEIAIENSMRDARKLINDKKVEMFKTQPVLGAQVAPSAPTQVAPVAPVAPITPVA